ncbi:MAG: hypothetical protein KIH63_001340 [Candidatus Saccharibacteria bacterium]|nr:hypothetical protein [Candidatus Saccharibacteria bacterium]
MFSSFAEEFFQDEVDRTVKHQNLDVETITDFALRQLEVNSDAEFFERLAIACEIAESDDVSPEDQLVAQATMFTAPFRYPESQTRSVAGAAYALRAFDWSRYHGDPVRLHWDLFERSVKDTVAGYDDLGVLDGYGLVRDIPFPEVLFDSYFSLADIMYACGPKALVKLKRDFGVTQFTKFPAEILKNQLMTPPGEFPEVPIFVPNEGNPGVKLLWQDTVYESIAAAASNQRRQVLPVIREYDGFDMEFFDHLVDVHEPVIGFVNGHGNWDNVGGIDPAHFEDLSYQKRTAIRRKWASAAGMALLSCNATSVSDDGDEPLAREFANTIGRPVVGSSEDVWEVDVNRLYRSGTDRWTVNFHVPPEVGRVHSTVEPQGYVAPSLPTKLIGKTITDIFDE